MGVEFKGKIMFHYPRGVKRQQGFTTAVGFYVYVMGQPIGIGPNGVVVDQPEFQSSGQSFFPGWGEFDLLFNVDILNPLFKNNGRETKGLVLAFL